MKQVKSNVLVNSTEVPEFEGFGRGNIVMHREYIEDVITSSTIGVLRLKPIRSILGMGKRFHG
jgi:hypothetical protein